MFNMFNFFKKPNVVQQFVDVPEAYSGIKNDLDKVAKEIVLDRKSMLLYSAELFETNPIVSGIFAALTAEILGDGLILKSTMVQEILKKTTEELEEIENIIDIKWDLYRKKTNFDEIAQIVLKETLLYGDCLVIVRYINNLPRLEVINARNIQTPAELLENKNIIDGIELKNGTPTAFYILTEQDTYKRVNVKAKSGRKQAFLVVNSRKKMSNTVRGTPILATIIQDLLDIDKYKNSAIRQALIASTLAVVVERDSDAKSPVYKGVATSKLGASPKDDYTQIVNNSSVKNLSSKFSQGTIVEGLENGEKIKTIGGDGTDVNFKNFNDSILDVMSIALQLPKEILKGEFSKSFSASKATNIHAEERMRILRDNIINQFHTKIYGNFLYIKTLIGDIEIPDFADNYLTENNYEIVEAYLKSIWFIKAKPLLKPLEAIQASNALIEMGASTYTEETRKLTGRDWKKNMDILKKEEEIMANLKKENI